MSSSLTKLNLNGAVLIQGGEEISDYSIEEQGSTDTEAALTLHVNGIAGNATITLGELMKLKALRGRNPMVAPRRA